MAGNGRQQGTEAAGLRRRAFIALAAGAVLAVPPGLRAQQRRAARVGWLTVTPNPQIESFREGMRALGYAEGANLTIDRRDAGGRADRLGALVADLVRQKPDVVVAVGFVAAQAMRQVSSGIPIVFVSNDAVEQGFAQSLARPGGSMTGIELMGDDINAKWLELLVELVPQARRFGLLEAAPTREGRKQVLLSAARALGKETVLEQVEQLEDLPPAIRAIADAGAQAMVVLPSALFHGARQQVVALAARHRLPAMYEHRDFVAAGGLLSYGPDIGAMFRRLADYVDRILRGISPATMPIERPTRFELVVNLKTARALGLAVPESFLARADEVIE